MMNNFYFLSGLWNSMPNKNFNNPENALKTVFSANSTQNRFVMFANMPEVLKT